MGVQPGEMTVAAALADAVSKLSASDTPHLDAQVLLANVLGVSRSVVLAHPETGLTGAQACRLERSLERLRSGEPLPYVLGEWEFFKLKFEVDRNVLIPRPDTELLVERGLEFLKSRRGKGNELRVLDVGTGCGCIAIALAVSMAEAHITATDISSAALDVARRNAARHNVGGQIGFIHADLFPSEITTEAGYDLVVANLPYIPTETLRRLAVFAREPTIALNGGEDGLKLIRRLIGLLPTQLKPDGMALLELEATQGSMVLELASRQFPCRIVHVRADLEGRYRILEIRSKED